VSEASVLERGLNCDEGGGRGGVVVGGGENTGCEVDDESDVYECARGLVAIGTVREVRYCDVSPVGFVGSSISLSSLAVGTGRPLAAATS
jgi:hypothetical protein